MQINGQRGLKRAIRDLDKSLKAVRPAIQRAVNRTATHALAFASKEIRDQVNLAASYIKGGRGKPGKLWVRKAKGSSTTATLSANRRAVLLTRFGATQLTRKAKGPSAGYPKYQQLGSKAKVGWEPGRKGAGVSVRVKSRGRKKKMRKAFFLRLKSGKDRQAGALGVAVRTGRGKHDYKVLHGPSVDQVFRNDVREQTERDARIFLRRQIGHEINYRMSKLWGKR